MTNAAFRTEAVGTGVESLSEIGSMAISIARWTIRSSRIGIPSGLNLPLAFGIWIRLTGIGR